MCAIAGDGLGIRVIADFNAVWGLAHKRDARRILADILVRLSESDRRACDRAARERLGSHAATASFAPVRFVLNANSYEAASVANRERTGAGLPIQAWHLVPKIREAGTVLREASHARDRVFESHPEPVFTAFADDPLPEPESTPEGRTRRLDVLRTVSGGCDGRNGNGNDDSDNDSEANTTDDRGFGAERAYRGTLDRTLRRDVVCDDVLDTLVLTAAVRRPFATLLSNPPTDTVGPEMTVRVPTGKPPPRTESDNHT